MSTDTELPSGRTISVGHLRQNPTAMIRAVRAGASYDLTERGLPIARIIPYAESRWVPSDEANAVLAAGGNPVWLAELLADRAAEPGEDPWRIE